MPDRENIFDDPKYKKSKSTVTVIPKKKFVRKTVERTIKVKAFLGNGKPTCAINFKDPANGVCRFLGLSRWGCVEDCCAMIPPQYIQREHGNSGFLRPVEDCPVWKEKK